MPSSSLRDRHILVVEDEYMLATELQAELEIAGATVIGPAPSVERALALVEEQPDIDAAVLDVNLGGEPVFPVADMLAGRSVPFVFATGYDDRAISDRYAHVKRCRKPLEFVELTKVLSTSLSR